MFCNTAYFQYMLSIERGRTERSQKPFLLFLLDVSQLVGKESRRDVLRNINLALDSSLRGVDIRGWYERDKVIGVIFTELTFTDLRRMDILISRVYERFCQCLSPEWIKMITISYHVFPENNEQLPIKDLFDTSLYPDINQTMHARQISTMIKTIFDALLSAVALVCLSPLFFAIAVAIKATSKGPVFFRQERVGLNGKPFKLLKFRSMKTNCDCASHKDYVTKFIREQKNAAVEPGVFKMTNDNRITPVGQFLRKTSLDELPQLINVLFGDMSLVGPRPPIPYECEIYDIWHRRRLLTCKPGITGLWQVTGRSSTTFDEMVRLDLKYITKWNLWLDLKIIFMTPKAVFKGKGAY